MLRRRRERQEAAATQQLAESRQPRTMAPCGRTTKPLFTFFNVGRTSYNPLQCKTIDEQLNVCLLYLCLPVPASM